MFYFQAKKYIYNKTKPTASPLQVARSRQAHGFSIKKKIQRMRNRTHHVAGACKNPITSLAEIKPHYPIQKQTKIRTQQTKHTNTEDRAQRCL